MTITTFGSVTSILPNASLSRTAYTAAVEIRQNTGSESSNKSILQKLTHCKPTIKQWLIKTRTAVLITLWQTWCNWRAQHRAYYSCSFLFSCAMISPPKSRHAYWQFLECFLFGHSSNTLNLNVHLLEDLAAPWQKILREILLAVIPIKQEGDTHRCERVKFLIYTTYSLSFVTNRFQD